MKRIQKIVGGVTCAAALLFAGCASDGNKRSTGQFIDDASIHARTKAALINDPVVAGTKINVDVNRGTVTLTGAVNGNVAKQKAEEIARGVDGVRSVENQLIVRDEAVGSSPSVSTEANVDRDRDVDLDADAKVKVDTDDGVEVKTDVDVDRR
jgi:hyperosmotically inducible periplasmic protein